MRQQSALNRINELLTHLVLQIRGATALGFTDINKLSEDCLVPVLSLAFGFACLRNLNHTEKQNYPAIDLADDDAETGIQVTATPDRSKVMETLEKFTAHGLHARYKRLLVYVLTERKERYTEVGIPEVLGGRFDINRDVIDYRDVLRALQGKPVETLDAVLSVLEKQLAIFDKPSPASEATGTDGRCMLTVSFEIVPSSTRDVHWYWLIVACSNNSPQKQDGYALELYFHIDIPVETDECQDEQPIDIGGECFRKITIRSNDTIFRTRTVQLVDKQRHCITYQINNDLYYRSKRENWRFLWKFYAGNLSVLEGEMAWKEMHRY